MSIKLKITKTLLFLFIYCFVFTLLSCEYNEEIDKHLDNEAIYEIHFIDVGQGDAIFIETDNKTLLVDGGGRNSNVIEYLNNLGVESIDIIIATHPHADHIGGLIEVFDTYKIGKVIDTGVYHTTITYNDYLENIEKNEIPLVTARKGMRKEIGDEAYLKILHPPEPITDYSRSYLNNASIVSRITLNEVSLLLTGDIQSEGESDLLSVDVDLESVILKVAHHGSSTSTTAEFLEAVNPEVSIIMCGKDNRYGHPHDETIKRLNATDTKIYRTDIDGHIIITTNGYDYEVNTTNDSTEELKYTYTQIE